MTAPVKTLDAYRDRINEIVAATDTSVQSIYGQLESDELDVGSAALLIAAVINLANARAVSIADRYLSLQITFASGEPVPAVGLLPTDDSARLRDAVSTILEDTPVVPQGQDTETTESSPRSESARESESPATEQPTSFARARNRLARIVQSEPWETAQRATTEGMKQQPLVAGWVRELNPSACTLCVYFYAKGRIYPADAVMKRHPACQCSQRVVLVPAGSIKPLKERKRNNR